MYERKYQARTVKGANHDSCHEVQEGTGHIGEEGWSDIPTKELLSFLLGSRRLLRATLFTGLGPTQSFRFVAVGKVPGDQPRKPLSPGNVCCRGPFGLRHDERS
jgi:hypothetical protein